MVKRVNANLPELMVEFNKTIVLLDDYEREMRNGE